MNEIPVHLLAAEWATSIAFPAIVTTTISLPNPKLPIIKYFISIDCVLVSQYL